MTHQRFSVIVNPMSGLKRGLRVVDYVRPVFAAAGVNLDVHVTRKPGHATEIVQSLNCDSCDGICVIGGDGTFHEVVDGLMHRSDPIPVPLGVIPAGTGNTIAEHLRIGDPLDAARKMVAGEPLPLDVVEVTHGTQTTYCVDMVGWGAVSDINERAEKWRWMGPPRYSAATLFQMLHPRRRQATLTLDGIDFEDEYLFVIACNPKFAGPRMLLAPHAELGDGKIDVVVIRNASRRDMLKLFTSVFDGSHLSLKFVEYHQVQTFGIQSPTSDALDLDGEMKGITPMSARVLPGVLRIQG